MNDLPFEKPFQSFLSPIRKTEIHSVGAPQQMQKMFSDCTFCNAIGSLPAGQNRGAHKVDAPGLKRIETEAK
ncbi:MAG: hypothetical protein QM690_16945 [Sphingobium sp.]